MTSILAAQLYTIRDFTKTTADFAASMKKIREMGYQAVQVSAIGSDIPQADVVRICDDNGLTICNTHIKYDLLDGDLDSIIEQHKLWKTKHVAIGSLPGQYRQDGEDGYKRFAAWMNGVGEKLAEAGLTFSYHNHSFEFVRFGSRNALEVIYEETDPRFVQAEIDTYWVAHGGGDPTEWILRMKDRMPVVHLKDMVMVLDDEGKAQHTMAEVGEGNLNWSGIMAALKDANVEWYAVEQDITPGDPFDSLAISFKNLTAMGLE